MKGDKKGELTLKPSYLKITRKLQKERLTILQTHGTGEQQRKNSIANKSLSSVFRIKSESDQASIHKKPYNSIIRVQHQNSHKQMETSIPKGCTPYQARKIAERSKTTQTITRILQKSRVQSRLQTSQDSCLVVKQIPTGTKMCEKKESTDIRDTDTTVNGGQMFHLLQKSRSGYEKPSSTLLNSWIFACNEELKSRNIKQQLTNKKLILKQLWKSKNYNDTESINSSKLDDIQKLKTIYKQKINDRRAPLGKKQVLYFQHPVQELLPRQNSIHSKKRKKTTTFYQHPKQCAFKIKPCTLESSSAFQNRTKSIYCSSSDSKIDVLRESTRKISPRKTNKSCKRFKTEEPLTKDVCGWDYVNDFSERQAIF